MKKIPYSIIYTFNLNKIINLPIINPRKKIIKIYKLTLISQKFFLIIPRKNIMKNNFYLIKYLIIMSKMTLSSFSIMIFLKNAMFILLIPSFKMTILLLMTINSSFLIQMMNF